MLTWYQALMLFVAPTLALYQFHPRASRFQSALFGLWSGGTALAFLGVNV
jgi:hypothetical protein